jgi:hypothetical protein
MGRTPKPLNISVDPIMLDWDEIKGLREQGHNIVAFPLDQEDLILGPTCWLMDDAHRKYLDLAIKSARARRYPKENE